MFKASLFAVLFFIVGLSISFAAENDDEPIYSVGYSPTYFANLIIDDPDGPTKKTTYFSLTSLSMLLRVSRTERLLTQLVYYDFKLDASSTDIGQRIDGYSFTGIYQKKFRLTRRFKPWFGIGMSANYYEITSRHTVDADGYLLTSHPNRKTDSLSYIINAGYTHEMSDAWDIDFNVNYVSPFDKGLEYISATGTLIYNF